MLSCCRDTELKQYLMSKNTECSRFVFFRGLHELWYEITCLLFSLRYKTVYFPTNLFFSGSQSSIWKVSNFSLQFLVVFWFADSWTFHSPAVGINTATYRHFSVPSSSETVIRWVLSVCLHSSVNWTSSATNNF